MIALSDIFDQDAAIASIRRAYVADRLPHGLIFAGPVGVGKATTARALAALFLCERPEGITPCGACDSCRALQANSHPDYHLITKELIRFHDKTGKSKGIDLSIHVLRPELIEPAGRKAVMGRGKVFVVEQAELMNPQAQNALLKTLEEPAGRTIIILLTDQPGALLPTIRSRTQTVRFSALPQGTVLRELGKRGIEPTAASVAGQFARGSLGIALKWIEDGVVGPAQELSAQLDNVMSGKSSGDLPALLKQAAESYASRQLERDELASKDQAVREGLELYLALAGEQVRSRLSGGDDPAQLERACSAIDAIFRAETYLNTNVNTNLVLQQLALSLERG